MRPDAWLCTVCKREAGEGADLQPSLSDKFQTGHCLGCRTYSWFRRPSGVELKDTGMAIVERAQDKTQPEWRADALRAVDYLVLKKARFTANDITDAVGLPEHRNAVGALLSGLARRGVIRRVGFQNGERSSQHARVVGVWEAA